MSPDAQPPPPRRGNGGRSSWRADNDKATSLAIRDQVEAASRDAVSLVYRFRAASEAVAPRLRWSEVHKGDLRPEARKLVLSALQGGRRCVHLRRQGPQPQIARLTIHRIDCVRCSATVVNPPADESDQCDLCQACDVERFTPVVLQVGPVVVMGDVCAACASLCDLREVA